MSEKTLADRIAELEKQLDESEARAAEAARAASTSSGVADVLAGIGLKPSDLDPAVLERVRRQVEEPSVGDVAALLGFANPDEMDRRLRRNVERELANGRTPAEIAERWAGYGANPPTDLELDPAKLAEDIGRGWGLNARPNPDIANIPRVN